MLSGTWRTSLCVRIPTRKPEVLSRRHLTLAMKHLLRKQERSEGFPPASGEWNRLLTTKSSPDMERTKIQRPSGV